MCSLLLTVKAALFIINREVSLRKQAEARTNELAQREAQRRMNEFLNIASHELKTPLTSIKGNIQLMGRRLKSSIEAQTASAAPATESLEPNNGNDNGSTKTHEVHTTSDANRMLIETKELLERTDKQVSQLTRLVNALLESARLDNNALNLRLEPFEMNKVVREVAQDAHYVHKKRTIRIEPWQEDLFVLADMQHVKQVVIHYLSNAHKFSPLEEQIDIVVRREDGQVHVSVHDNGLGIDPKEHNKIWERFYRVPEIEVLNGSEVGLGLGLYLSRVVIEQHNGKVGVKSTPGAGSTFWFTLPLMDEEDSSS